MAELKLIQGNHYLVSNDKINWVEREFCYVGSNKKYYCDAPNWQRSRVEAWTYIKVTPALTDREKVMLQELKEFAEQRGQKFKYRFTK